MSLIEEALRRVKDPLVPPASSTPAKPAKTSRQAPASSATPAAHSWSPAPSPLTSRTPHTSSFAPLTMVALAVLALTAALIVGGAVWMWHTLNGNHWMAQGSSGTVSDEPATSEPSGANHANSDHATQTAHTASKTLVREFNVTGVVVGSGDPYAMINGSIVAVGETIGRATLMGISEGKVTLRLADGKETVVQVER